MEDFFVQYGPIVGYIALLLGSFVEGESFVLTAGFLAFKGYLSLPVTIAVAFTGSVVADQLLYFMGRAYGPRYLSKRPKMKERAERAFTLLHRYNVWFILGFRFVYGIRTVSPLVIGTSGISVKRFAILNVIAGIIWATVSCYAGYYLGYFFADNLSQGIDLAVRFQQYTVGGIIGLILLIAGFVIYRRKRHKKRQVRAENLLKNSCDTASKKD